MQKRAILTIWMLVLLAVLPIGTQAAPLTVALVGRSTHHQHLEGQSPTAQVAGIPTVQILEPANGAVLNTRDVVVTFQTSNHEVGSIGTPHIHFHLDNDAIPFMFFNGDDPTAFGQQAVLFDFDLTSRATWVDPNTVRFNALSNGPHTLVVHLVDGHHNRLENPEATQTITFTVDVPPDDATPPAALIFVKEERGEQGMDRRVFDNDPDIISDLYLLHPVQPDGTVTQLTDVARFGGGIMGPEVSWDGQRVLFAMRQDAEDTWHIWEMNVDGTELRQITFDPPYLTVNDLDPEYLPDGRIIFASDRLKQRDEYNVTISTQLYVVNADGTDLHLVEPNPSHNLNPQVIRDGRVTFDRWDHLAHRNKFTAWQMNQDGSSGFVFFGGASPRGGDKLGNAQGIERRELVDGELVGIFTHRDQLPGTMAVFDIRNGNLEDSPRPIVLGPAGLYRTPHPLTTYELVYSYAAGDDPVQAQFGLYTMPWIPEEVLVDDTTVSTAPGPGMNYAFRTYTIELDAPSRVYVEVTGMADDNGAADDDDLWLLFDGIEHKTLERRLDGELDQGLPRTFRADVDFSAGSHLIQIATDETPTVKRVRIVRGIRGDTPTLLYDDPATNEVSPIPVRARIRPPIYPSKVNRDLNWGVFLVRDISLRGDFRQPNFTSPEGDPNYNFHLDLAKLRGLRVFQSLPRRNRDTEVLAGSHPFEAVRVVGVAEPNEFGTVAFQALANNVTAWDLIGHDGAAIVHERVWSLVQPGEVRACGGCHVPPQFPFVQREIGPIPPPTDLRGLGKVYTFEDDVLSILQQKCQTCHLGDGAAAGLNLRGDRTTFDALIHAVDGRLPAVYVEAGDARDSFLFHLLTGDARGKADFQARVDAVNAVADHTGLLSNEEWFALATWIDTGAGFAFLPDGEAAGAPEAVGMLPRPGSTAVAQNTGVALYFNAPIDRATLDSRTFELRAVGGAAVAGTWHWGSNRAVLFRPAVPLSAGEYEVVVQGSVLDIKDETVGQSLERPFQARFTVGNLSDTTAPTVLPQALATTPTPVTGPVTLQFSEPLDPGSINPHTLWVETAAGERVDGRVALSADGREAAFAPYLPFTAGATYTLRLQGRVQDLAGNGSDNNLARSFTVVSTPAPQYHALVADRKAGNGPEKVAVSPDGTRVLVANHSSDSVALYDGTTWDWLQTFESVGDGPHDVAFAPDGTRILVLSTGTDEVRILRLSDGAPLATITGIGQAHLMALNPPGTRLYVTDTGDPDQLHELDVDPASPTFGRVLRSLGLDTEPYDVAVGPAGRLVYVSGRNGVTIVDVDVWAARRFVEVPWRSLGEIALTPDGRQAYVADRWADKLHVIDLITGQVVGHLPTQGSPESVAVSPDGRFVYVAERDSKTVAVVDVGTFQVIRRLPSGTGATTGLAVSPDSRLLYAPASGWPGRLTVFHLGDLSDEVAPQVTRVQPAHTSTRVALYDPLLIDLSEAVDRLSVHAESVQLLHKDVVIHGTLAVSPDNRLIWFRPGVMLQPGTTYELRVTTEVKDLAGNGLASATVVEFTTADQPMPPPIGLWATPPAGDYPYGVAVTPAGERVLVTDYWGDRLRLLDTATWEEVRLELEHNVGRVAVSPNGRFAYVLRPDLNDVVVVDLSTDQVVDLNPDVAGLQGISVGTKPVNLLHHPTSQRLYVVNRDSSDVSVIDTQTRQEIARWPVNGVAPQDRNAFGVVLSPDQAHLLVTSVERLSILDASDGHLVRLYDNLPGWSYYDVLVTPDGQQAWLAAADAGALVVIDLRIGEIVAQVSVGTYPQGLALSPDGERIYVSDGQQGLVSVLDRRTGRVLNGLPASGKVYGVALSPDGRRLFVPNDAADALLVYEHADPADEAGPTVLQITPTPGSQDLAVITPLVIDFDEPLDRASVNSATFRVTRSTNPTPSAEGMVDDVGLLSEVTVEGRYVFSADNRSVTFVPGHPWQAGETYTLRLESGLTDMAGNPLGTPHISTFDISSPLEPPVVSLRPERYASSGPEALALAPDGRRLVVADHHADTISVLNAATLITEAEIPVGDGPVGMAFSADSQRLYVVNEHSGSLAVVDLTRAQVSRTLTGLPIGVKHLLLAADETQAFVTGYETGGIDVVDLATGQVTRLQELDRPGRPAFAPDGTLYVPARDRLWRREANGQWTSLYLGSGYIAEMAFAPDGRHAYLSASWEDRLRVVDLVLWEPLYALSVGAEPGALALTTDSRLLMVANQEAGAVQLIDRLTHTMLQTAVVSGSKPYALAWDEGRRRLYLADGISGQVYSFDIAYGNTSGTVIADVSGDGSVDMKDVEMVAQDWRSTGRPSDVNRDGQVNIVDLMFVIASMEAP